MANSDKNILITPFVGGITQPQIAFVGQGNDPIYLRVLDGVTGTGATAGGALSVEGSAGQLFSIVNRLGTGSIFSVNDISGIPSIDVDANGTIVFAGFTGNVGIGVTAPTNKLSVAGNISATGTVTGSRLVYALNGLTGGVTLIAGANITLTSSAAGITIASTASGSGGGVSTLNGLSGGITLNAGTNVTITSSVAGGITIAASGSGGDNVVTSFNGRTGAVQGVSAAVAGDGITVSGATGAVTITNSGVTRAVAGTGISVTANTGTVSISNTGVLSFNGNAGVVQGVSAAVAGTGISVSGATGAVTITNIGVQSFNGLTGAVGGVCAAQTNTFTATQAFSAGICMSVAGLFSSQTLTVTSTSAGITNAGFLYVGGGATFNSSVATNTLISPGATLTVQSGIASTARNLHLFPYGQVIIQPQQTGFGSGGDTPKVVVQNADNALGQVQISGGNLYLGTALDSESTAYPVDIIFANPTTAFTTTLTAPNTASNNKTITLPNATGTVALTNAVVTGLNGITGGITLNAGTNVTITSSVAGGITIAASGGGGGGDGVTSFNGLTGAVTGTSVARHWFI